MSDALEHVVGRDRLEEALEKVRSRVKDPKAGLFGPGSVAWRIYPEMVLGIGGGRALLLQTAHPFVAHAVAQHSAYQTDPHGRGERTFRALFAWLYGDLDSALKAARRVHAVHSRITGGMGNRVGPYEKGDPYAANEEGALLWVHATLWDTPMQVYELIFGEQSRADKARYYEETKLFAYLFGISDDVIPPMWDDFREYVERMQAEELYCDEASLDVARYVLKPPTESLTPVIEWYKIMTAGLMHPRVRHGYRFKWGMYEKFVFESSIRALRAVVPRTPAVLRQSPLYRKALHRVLGTERSPAEKFMARTLSRFERQGMASMAGAN